MNQKLNAWALATALGVLSSFAILIVSIIAIKSTDYLHNIVQFLSSIYIGYDLSPIGIVLGMLWGFVDAAIGGLLFAWLYNKLAK